MENLELIIHLSRRRSQLYEEELRQYGIVSMLQAGLTVKDNPFLPISIFEDQERELQARIVDRDGIRKSIDQLQTYIEAIAESEIENLKESSHD